MEEKTIAEIEKITQLLIDFGVSEKRISLLEPVIENTAFMKAKLDDSKELVMNSSIAIAYDNGGGQKGIRENPIFKAYESLWKSYMSGIDRIFNVLPDEESRAAVVQELKPQTMLEIVRNKRRSCL